MSENEDSLSIPIRRGRRYTVVFTVLILVITAIVLYYEVGENNTDSLAATVMAVLRHMGWAIVVSTAVTYYGVEVYIMIAELFKKEERERGRREERERIKRRFAKLFENKSDSNMRAEIERILREDD